MDQQQVVEEDELIPSGAAANRDQAAEDAKDAGMREYDDFVKLMETVDERRFVEEIRNIVAQQQPRRAAAQPRRRGSSRTRRVQRRQPELASLGYVLNGTFPRSGTMWLSKAEVRRRRGSHPPIDCSGVPPAPLKLDKLKL